MRIESRKNKPGASAQSRRSKVSESGWSESGWRGSGWSESGWRGSGWSESGRSESGRSTQFYLMDLLTSKVLLQEDAKRSVPRRA
jgi:hypothetical protein